MKVEVDGALHDGVTAKDIILAIIGQIGTAGGTGHVIEYCGSAIEALSMEGRMTVCNMSIEGGARAGMVAPDEKTYAYLEGPPEVAEGRAVGSGAPLLGYAAHRRRRAFRRDHPARRRRSAADRHLGHQPAGRDHHRRLRAAHRGRRDRGQARFDQARARLHGPAGRREDHRPRARPRLHRLLHQRPHRGFARRREDRGGPQGRRAGQRA